MKVGDAVVFGFAGPPSRVDAGRWSDAVMREGHLVRVTKPPYVDPSVRWDDVIYEHRFGFEAVEPPRRPLTDADFGTDVLEALRVSANSYGLPVAASISEDLILNGLAGPVVAASLEIGSELDRIVQAIARVEQQQLRAGLLAGAAVAECALCGNSFHAEHLVAAHIKRRSACSPAERLERSNVMLCCRFGCDELFEHGYVAVDTSGVVVSNSARPVEPREEAAISALEGRTCPAWSFGSADFFAWHRAEIAKL